MYILKRHEMYSVFVNLQKQVMFRNILVQSRIHFGVNQNMFTHQVKTSLEVQNDCIVFISSWVFGKFYAENNIWQNIHSYVVWLIHFLRSACKGCWDCFVLKIYTAADVELNEPLKVLRFMRDVVISFSYKHAVLWAGFACHSNYIIYTSLFTDHYPAYLIFEVDSWFIRFQIYI